MSVHPTELCCNLLSYAATSEQCCTRYAAPLWARLSVTELNYNEHEKSQANRSLFRFKANIILRETAHPILGVDVLARYCEKKYAENKTVHIRLATVFILGASREGATVLLQ